MKIMDDLGFAEGRDKPQNCISEIVGLGVQPQEAIVSYAIGT